MRELQAEIAHGTRRGRAWERREMASKVQKEPVMDRIMKKRSIRFRDVVSDAR